jgi:hypothetical protein
MPEHRRYTKRQKLAAVMATEMAGVVQASKQTGIPATTIEYWLHKPEFAEVRTRTREDLAEEVKVVAHLAWRRVAETMPQMEPRDAMFAAEKASTILQLLTGQATSRTESRDLTGDMDDHEREALRQVLEEVMSGEPL